MTNISVVSKKSDPLYESILFVSKALATSKSELNESLKLIQVNNGRIIATDGHRLHIAHVDTDMLPGLYQLTKSAGQLILTKSDYNCTYPNIDMVIPKDNDLSIPFVPATQKDKASERISSFMYKLAETGNCVNFKYIQDITDISEWTCKVKKHSDLHPILFNNCKHEAVIMPINIKS